MPGDVARETFCSACSPGVRGQQYRVRGDARARLTRGLVAPLINGLLPVTRLRLYGIPQGRPIFIIPGDAKRHPRLTPYDLFEPV